MISISTITSIAIKITKAIDPATIPATDPIDIPTFSSVSTGAIKIALHQCVSQKIKQLTSDNCGHILASDSIISCWAATMKPIGVIH